MEYHNAPSRGEPDLTVGEIALFSAERDARALLLASADPSNPDHRAAMAVFQLHADLANAVRDGDPFLCGTPRCTTRICQPADAAGVVVMLPLREGAAAIGAAVCPVCFSALMALPKNARDGRVIALMRGAFPDARPATEADIARLRAGRKRR